MNDERAKDSNPADEPTAEKHVDVMKEVEAPPVEKKTDTVAPPPATAPVEKPRTGGGVLVLQWLTYAFWGWFAVSMGWLSAMVFAFFVARGSSSDWGGALAYPLAAVIILFIIAFVTDFLYSRHEPAKKVGGANVIMLLHVVPFVLTAIASLVTIVFCIITMVLNGDPADSADGPLISMLTALVVMVLYAGIAARAFFGGGRRLVRLIAWVGFGVIALGFIVTAIAGPASEAVRTKNDRLIESALPTLASDIRSYTAKNDKLPANISDVTHTSSYGASTVQKVLDKKLVTYKANTLPSTKGNSYSPGDDYSDTLPMSGKSSGVSVYSSYGAKRFYYQLCTTYKTEKKNEYNYSSEAEYTTDTSAGVSADYRHSSLSIASHPAGQVCYDLYADGKYSYSNY